MHSGRRGFSNVWVYERELEHVLLLIFISVVIAIVVRRLLVFHTL